MRRHHSSAVEVARTDEEGQEGVDEVAEEAPADHPVDERGHGTEREKGDEILSSVI